MRQWLYLFLDVCPARQARNAAAACSRSSALLNLRRSCFGGSLPTGILSLRSSTPCRRMRLRLATRDQFARTITPPPSTSAKPPVNDGKSGGSAVAPQTGHVAGAVEPITPERSSLGPTPPSYTRASRLGTNWVKADVSAFTAKPPGRAG